MSSTEPPPDRLDDPRAPDAPRQFDLADVPGPLDAEAVQEAPGTTFHATVVGVDRPGITSRMFTALAQTTVLDVEQVVVAGQLVLGAVVRAPAGSEASLCDALRDAVPDFDVSLRPVPSTDVAGDVPSCTVTIVGRAITGRDIAALAAVIAGAGANIVRIDRIADYPVTVLAFEVAAPDRDAARQIALRLYTGIRAAHDWGQRFDPEPAEAVLERMAALAPREMRRAWMTAFGNARLDGRATLSLDDLPEAPARRAPIGFTN